MEFYTLVEIQVGSNWRGVSVSLTSSESKHRRRSYKQPSANLLPAINGPWYEDKEDTHPHAKLLRSAQKQMVVVVGAGESELADIGRRLRNCIIFPYGNKLCALPLSYFVVINQLFFVNVLFHAQGRDTWHREDANKLQHSLNNKPEPFEIFVDGEPFNSVRCCEGCPKAMNRVMSQCYPNHPTCIKTFPPFYLRKDKRKLDISWFEQRPMQLSAMPKGDYVEFKNCVAPVPFSTVGFNDIVNDLADAERARQGRSDAASLAAATRRFKKAVCSGCLWQNGGEGLSKAWGCHRHGGCKQGPAFAEDIQPIIKACQPWMIQAAFMGAELPPTFKGSKRHRLSWLPVGPSLQPKPEMALVKIGARNVEHIRVPFDEYCKLVNMKPAETWEDVASVFNSTRVDPDAIKYVTVLVARSELRNIQWGSRFGSYTRTFAGFELSPYGAIYATFVGGTCHQFNKYDVTELENLMNHHYVRFDGVFEFTPERKLENQRIRELAMQARTCGELEDILAALRANPDWLKGPIPYKKARRIIRRLWRIRTGRTSLEKEELCRQQRRASRRQLKFNFGPITKESANGLSSSLMAASISTTPATSTPSTSVGSTAPPAS